MQQIIIQHFPGTVLSSAEPVVNRTDDVPTLTELGSEEGTHAQRTKNKPVSVGHSTRTKMQSGDKTVRGREAGYCSGLATQGQI